MTGNHRPLAYDCAPRGTSASPNLLPFNFQAKAISTRESTIRKSAEPHTDRVFLTGGVNGAPYYSPRVFRSPLRRRQSLSIIACTSDNTYRQEKAFQSYLKSSLSMARSFRAMLPLVDPDVRDWCRLDLVTKSQVNARSRAMHQHARRCCRAYRRLAQLYHPDKNESPDATQF